MKGGLLQRERGGARRTVALEVGNVVENSSIDAFHLSIVVTMQQTIHLHQEELQHDFED